MERLRLMAFLALLPISGMAWAGPFEDGSIAMDRGDFVTAASKFQGAAAQGHAQAQYNLGMLLEKGRGVPQDYEGAIRLYLQAAAQGHAEAQRNLGVMYRDGLGVPRDPVRAYMWLNLGAAEGVAFAAGYRDAVARGMSPEQRVLAQKMATECKQRGFKGCGVYPQGTSAPGSAPVQQ